MTRFLLSFVLLGTLAVTWASCGSSTSSSTDTGKAAVEGAAAKAREAAASKPATTSKADLAGQRRREARERAERQKQARERAHQRAAARRRQAERAARATEELEAEEAEHREGKAAWKTEEGQQIARGLEVSLKAQGASRSLAECATKLIESEYSPAEAIAASREVDATGEANSVVVGAVKTCEEE